MKLATIHEEEPFVYEKKNLNEQPVLVYSHDQGNWKKRAIAWSFGLMMLAGLLMFSNYNLTQAMTTLKEKVFELKFMQSMRQHQSGQKEQIKSIFDTSKMFESNEEKIDCEEAQRMMMAQQNEAVQQEQHQQQPQVTILKPNDQKLSQAQQEALNHLMHMHHAHHGQAHHHEEFHQPQVTGQDPCEEEILVYLFGKAPERQIPARFAHSHLNQQQHFQQ